MSQRVRHNSGVELFGIEGSGYEEMLLGLGREGKCRKHSSGIRAFQQEEYQRPMQRHPCFSGDVCKCSGVRDWLVGVRVHHGMMRVVHGERSVGEKTIKAKGLALGPPIGVGKAEKAAISIEKVVGAEQSTQIVGRHEWVIAAADVYEKIPIVACVDRELHGVHGVEHHTDTAIGDDFRLEHVDVSIVHFVGFEEDGGGMFALPLRDLFVKVQNVDVVLMPDGAQ